MQDCSALSRSVPNRSDSSHRLKANRATATGQAFGGSFAMIHNRFRYPNERAPRILAHDLARGARRLFEADPNDVGSSAGRLP